MNEYVTVYFSVTGFSGAGFTYLSANSIPACEFIGSNPGKASQQLKAWPPSLTFPVFQPSPTYKSERTIQLKNILFIFVTLDVSKLLISNSVRDLQFLNIEFILVALDVSQPKILSSSNSKQLLNIHKKVVTFDVSQLLRSNFSRDSHILNIYEKLVALLVSKFSRPLISFNFLKFQKRSAEYALAAMPPEPPMYTSYLVAPAAAVSSALTFIQALTVPVELDADISHA